MKRKLLSNLLIILSFFQILNAQWQSLGGPEGGTTKNILSIEESLFVSASPGGVFKSNDFGDSWLSVNDGLASSEISVLKSDDGILYAALYGRGLWKSLDEGASWSSISAEVERNTYYALLVNGNRIYAGHSNGGIQYSLDGGETWSFGSGNFGNFQFRDFAVFGDKVLAGGQSLHSSENDGASWQEIEIDGLDTGGVRSILATEDAVFVADNRSVFISEDETLNNWSKLNVSTFATISSISEYGSRIYITTSNGRYFYTDDSGTTWIQVKNPLTSSFVNDLTVLNERIVMSTSEGVFSSLDGGANWVRSNSGLNAHIIESLYANEDFLFVGTNSQGVFRFDRSSEVWMPKNNGLNDFNSTAIYDIVESESDIHLATGSGVYSSSNDGDTWNQRLYSGSNYALQVIKYDNGTLLAGPGPESRGLYRSTNGGNSWDVLDIDPLNNATSYSHLFFQDDDIIVSTHSGEIFLSRNKGTTWTDISIRLGGGYFFPYEVHMKNGVLYAATGRGVLYSEDFGASWNYFKNLFVSTRAIIVENDMFYAITESEFLATRADLNHWYPYSDGLNRIPPSVLVSSAEDLILGTYGSSAWKRLKNEIELPESTAFITTWKTDNPGVSNDNQITIPTYTPFEWENPLNYDYNVDWGDGTTSTNVTGDITHTYGSPGTYTVSITGAFPRIYFGHYNNETDKEKILTIEQWGNQSWTSMSRAFAGCANLDVVATDEPNLFWTTDMGQMFEQCSSLVGNDSFSNWDTGSVTNMSDTFDGAELFNQPIGSWDVGNVRSFYGMFWNAKAFNQPLGAWNMSNARGLGYMFYGTAFNQPIGSWDVSNVEYFYSMFQANTNFNQDISSWNMGSAVWMSNMFTNATSFNQDISGWNVENVQQFFGMFENATAFDQNLGSWNIKSARDMWGMFNFSGLSQTNYDSILIGWNSLEDLRPNVVFSAIDKKYCEGGQARANLVKTYGWSITDDGISADCTVSQFRPFVTTWNVTEMVDSQYQITIPTSSSESYEYTIDWGDGTTTANVSGDAIHSYENPGTYQVRISGIFPRIVMGGNTENSAFLQSVDQWGDVVWTSMEEAFAQCINLDVVAKDFPDLSGVTNARRMFFNCQALVGNDSFDQWNVSTIVDMSEMFANTPNFNQILNSWNTEQVTNMFRLFYESGFENSLGSWNVSNVSEMTEMFAGAKMTQENYDNTLVGWSRLPQLQPNVIFDAGDSQFCLAEEAKQSIIETYNWSINDAGLNCPERLPFVTTWRTDNLGKSNDNQLKLPSRGGPFTIDWGDGTVENEQYGEVQHTYGEAGVYTVRITGDFSGLAFYSYPGNENNSDATKLLFINQWGDVGFSSSHYGGCSNMDVIAPDAPDLSGTTSLRNLFSYCSAMEGNDSFNDWDVSRITDMTETFYACTNFNADISSWDVSQVQNMSNLFVSCSKFNQDLSGWDVSNVTEMQYMFTGATEFNQPIGNWNVSKVTDMAGMFQSAKFNQDISGWDVSNVTDMRYMFGNAREFNQDLSSWDVSKVTNMQYMFGYTSMDQDLGPWNVGQVTNMRDMFNGVTMSVENYDNTLIGWSQLPTLQPNVVLGAPDNQYCTAAEARQNIIDTYGWTINDRGEATDCGTEQRPFITTWKTDNPGVSEDNQITIPTFPGETYNYTVDWGDGSIENNVTGNAIHTYASPGIYQIAIIGDFPWIYFNGQGDKDKIISIDQWGSIEWQSMSAAFSGCSNLDVKATDIPDLSNVTSTRGMFSFCESLVGNESFALWQMDNVKGMGSMFVNAERFNQDLSNWDVSSVVNTENTFQGTGINSDLSSWDVSQVTDMSGMFSGSDFNQDISNWDVSNVTDMNAMFSNSNYNQDISNWDVSNVETMSWMFQNNENFNQDISTWNVSRVTSMLNMFNSATSFNQNLADWDVSSVTNMTGMFQRASSFNQNLNSWNVSSVTDMMWMFGEAISFDQDLGDWDISNVQTMSLMFDAAGLSVENYDSTLIGWNTLDSGESQIPQDIIFNGGNGQFCLGETARQNLIDSHGWTINDAGLAEDCQRPFITTWTTFSPEVSEDNQDNTILIPTFPGETYDYTVDWGDGNISENVTGDITHTYDAPGRYTVSISGVFPRFFYDFRSGSEKILSVDQWGDIQWTSMERAFMGCYNMDMVATDAPDLSRVTSMSYMFQDCVRLSDNDSYNLWDVSTVTDLSGVFVMSSFNSSIVDWDVGQVTNMFSLFSKCPFNQDIGNWDTSKVENMSYMFELDTSFNYDIGGWDTSSVINMFKMFDSATSFNQNLGQWDVSNVSDMRDMFGNSDFSNGLSNENYDQTLIGWSQLPSLQNGVQLDAPQNQYCLAKEARQSIIDAYGWTINDAGEAEDCQRPFITMWDTRLPGGTDNLIVIRTHEDLIYNYDIDWGDGSSSNNVVGDAVHRYETPGLYEVSISGTFPGINLGRSTLEKRRLIEIKQWGDIEWETFEQAFNGCLNMDVIARDIPDLTRVKSLANMFGGCVSLFGNTSFNNWDVSQITNMFGTFGFAQQFNQNIADWDVSNVQDMTAMFAGLEIFNQDIGDWDVSSVISMFQMFDGASRFNQDISGWNVISVENMSLMFRDAISFNQDISGWNVANNTRMRDMFAGATLFNQNLGDWNISQVIDALRLFNNSGLSNENYDKTLIGWSQLSSLQNGVTLDAPQNQYCEAKEARQFIIDTYGWTINDAGEAEDCETVVDCPANLPNEDEDIVLSEGSSFLGIDEVLGTSEMTNDSDCALALVNNDAGQLFANYRIPIDLVANGIQAGDELFISLDGNSSEGVARIELLRDNTPNQAELSHTYIGGWSTFSETIVVPEDISSLDIWLYSNYLSNEPGTAYYDNLIVQILTSGGNIAPIALAGNDQTLVDNDENGGEEVSLDGSGSFDPDGSIVSYSWSDGSVEIATGENATVTLPVGVNILTLTVTDNDGDMGTDTLTINIVDSTSECPDDLPNEDLSIPLSGDGGFQGLDNFAGTSAQTNGSPCALIVTNNDVNQPFANFRIPIDLAAYGINPGDELFISLDGNSAEGVARIEVNQDNRPNTALVSNTYLGGWSTFSETVIVPSGVTTINLWLYSNYLSNAPGTAYYDNLIVTNLSAVNEPCPDDLPNEEVSIPLVGQGGFQGLDSFAATSTITNDSPCALEVTNTDADQPFANYRIPIVLEDHGISPGDQLLISLDGNSSSGIARVEINQDNSPNTALASNTYEGGWSTFSETIVVPDGITSINLWLYSNYLNFDSGGTAYYDNLIVRNLGPLAIPATFDLNSLDLWPNPANETVNISFERPTEVVEFQIFDLMGRLIRTFKVDNRSSEFELPVYDLPVGAYFIKTMDENGQLYDEQMMIQR